MAELIKEVISFGCEEEHDFDLILIDSGCAVIPRFRKDSSPCLLMPNFCKVLGNTS